MPAKSVFRSGNQQATMVNLLKSTGRTLPVFLDCSFRMASSKITFQTHLNRLDHPQETRHLHFQATCVANSLTQHL